MPQRLSEVPLMDLVPELRQWNHGAGIDLDSYAAFKGTIELAIAFGEFFWPDFIEMRGCIFRGESETDSIRQWFDTTLETMGEDLSGIESLYNHLHIWDLFPDAFSKAQPTREQCLYLARLLRELWESKLSREFPSRHLRVVVNEDDPEGDFQVTFFQIRETSNDPRRA